MVSQKNLSHSSLIWSVAPPRRLLRLGAAVLAAELRFFLGVSASSLSLVMAARGGLDGGDGSPEKGTSGIPLCPGSHRSAVVEALERGGDIGDVAASEDASLAGEGGVAVTFL